MKKIIIFLIVLLLFDCKPTRTYIVNGVLWQSQGKIFKRNYRKGIKSNFQNFFKLPDMSNFIVLQYFDSIFKKLYYYYKGMTDTSSSDKFYRNFVPVNGRIHEIYDTWYLRVNNQDKLIYGPK